MKKDIPLWRKVVGITATILIILAIKGMCDSGAESMKDPVNIAQYKCEQYVRHTYLNIDSVDFNNESSEADKNSSNDYTATIPVIMTTPTGYKESQAYMCFLHNDAGEWSLTNIIRLK